MSPSIAAASAIAGVMSLFGDWGDSDASPDESNAGFDERSPIPDIEFDKGDRLKAEKEMLGLYVSDHPLFGVEAALKRKRRPGRSPTSNTSTMARWSKSAA